MKTVNKAITTSSELFTLLYDDFSSLSLRVFSLSFTNVVFESLSKPYLIRLANLMPVVLPSTQRSNKNANGHFSTGGGEMSSVSSILPRGQVYK